MSLGSDNLGITRKKLLDKLNKEAFVEAASIAAIFNGLVRTADSSGIPLDDSTKSASEAFRADLGLNSFPGAANTERNALKNGGKLV